MDPAQIEKSRAIQTGKVKELTELMTRLHIKAEYRQKLDPKTGFIEDIVVFLTDDFIPETKVEDAK